MGGELHESCLAECSGELVQEVCSADAMSTPEVVWGVDEQLNVESEHRRTETKAEVENNTEQQ